MYINSVVFFLFFFGEYNSPMSTPVNEEYRGILPSPKLESIMSELPKFHECIEHKINMNYSLLPSILK